MGLSVLTSAFYNSNRGKDSQPVKAEDFQHFGKILENMEPSKFSASLCKTFEALNKAGLLPPWAITIAPIDELRKGFSSTAAAHHPGAWIAPGVVILAPKVELDRLFSPLILVDEIAGGWIQFYNIETQAKVERIEIPHVGGAGYITDADLAVGRIKLD
jgi:hypothetical protein